MKIGEHKNMRRSLPDLSLSDGINKVTGSGRLSFSTNSNYVLLLKRPGD